jgi:hypothetical protein
MKVLKDRDGNEFYPNSAGVYCVDVYGEYIIHLTIEEIKED